MNHLGKENSFSFQRTIHALNEGLKLIIRGGDEMRREINPKDTTRAMAYELWMKAPNPMVTFFKTLDVTNLIKVSKRKNLKC